MGTQGTKESSGRRVRIAARKDKDEKPAVVAQVADQGQPAGWSEDLHARIAKRAYEIYVERGGQPGDALRDWLEAERELLGAMPNA